MLGPSEGGLGGQDAPDGFPASGRNVYLPGANAFFADVVSGVDGQDGSVGGGEGVEHGNVTPPSDSGSQSSKGCSVG